MRWIYHCNIDGIYCLCSLTLIVDAVIHALRRWWKTHFCLKKTLFLSHRKLLKICSETSLLPKQRRMSTILSFNVHTDLIIDCKFSMSNIQFYEHAFSHKNIRSVDISSMILSYHSLISPKFRSQWTAHSSFMTNQFRSNRIDGQFPEA